MAWLETLAEAAKYGERIAEGVQYATSGDPSVIDESPKLAGRESMQPVSPTYGLSFSGLIPVLMVGGLALLVFLVLKR